MYSRTQVSSASASWRVNSGVTARDLDVATMDQITAASIASQL